MGTLGVGRIMKPIEIDFAPPPAWRRWLPWGFALLALGASAGFGWRTVETWQAVQVLKARNDEFRARIDARRLAQAAAAASAATPPPWAEDARRLAGIAAFDLEGVLLNVEAAQVEGVRLRTMDVSPSEASARLEIDAPSTEAVLAYVQALNAGLPTAVWHLERLQSDPSVQTATVGGRWPRERP
jgi:hypothetical protein